MDTSQLIPLLQEIQQRHGYLPRSEIERAAETLRITPAQVMAVATFYAQFRFTPVGEFLIQVCKGTACHVNGASQIGEALSEFLHISDGETTPDGKYTLSYVACLGCCSLSPVMTVNGKPHGKLTAGTAVEIIKKEYS